MQQDQNKHRKNIHTIRTYTHIGGILEFVSVEENCTLLSCYKRLGSVWKGNGSSIYAASYLRDLHPTN